MNKKVTSRRVASDASKTLNDQRSSASEKKMAASALSQAARGRETGKAIEKEASDAMKNKRLPQKTKAIAASLVAQSNKKR